MLCNYTVTIQARFYFEVLESLESSIIVNGKSTNDYGSATEAASP